MMAAQAVISGSASFMYTLTDADTTLGRLRANIKKQAFGLLFSCPNLCKSPWPTQTLTTPWASRHRRPGG